MKAIGLFCLGSVLILSIVGCEDKESTSGRFRTRPVKAEVVLGRTRLHSAPNWTIAKRLIAQGADVNAKDSFGMTPLHTAVIERRRDVVEVLVAGGADIDARSNSGQTPLFWAVAQSHQDIIEYLIVSGADINAKDKYGITPLHWAAAYTDRNVTELLVSHGADINTKDDNGRTALWHAKQKGRTEIVEFLSNVIDREAGLIP